MKIKIWTVLTQILCNRNDLINIIKPFFENLRDENIKDDKYIPYLNTFLKYQLDVLYKNGIITEEKNYLHLHSDKKKFSSDTNNEKMKYNDNNAFNKFKEIISGDKVIELQDFIQKNDIKIFKPTIIPFKEVETMQIPIIQYCIP